MRTLFVGDVHGCAAELRELIAAAQADRVVLVGDLFTKGPDPVGVWQAVRSSSAIAVLGNHDARLLQCLRGEREDDRHARSVVERLDAGALGWRNWVMSLPVFRRVAGMTVVHAGLHPSGDLERTSRQMALSMRRWPERSDAPLWHSLYRGSRRVVFGHDARRGLVRVERDGVPWVIGLDTGCVYGGALSGWLAEEDRLLQVAAKAVYRPVKARRVVRRD